MAQVALSLIVIYLCIFNEYHIKFKFLYLINSINDPTYQLIMGAINLLYTYNYCNNQKFRLIMMQLILIL